MTLPAGITTCTVTIGKALGSLGEDASLSGTLTLDRRLVWSATGDTLYGVPSTVTPSQSGGWLSFVVAHVDQAGFVDQSGNSITGFSYTFNGRATFADGSVEPIVKHFQVFVGETTKDLDLLPDGPVTLPVSAPTTSVTSIAGLTGVVSQDDLEGLGIGGVSDSAVAGQITNGALTGAALDDYLSSHGGGGGTGGDPMADVQVYGYTPVAAKNTRTALNRALSGLGDFHIMSRGDSIANGGNATIHATQGYLKMAAHALADTVGLKARQGLVSSRFQGTDNAQWTIPGSGWTLFGDEPAGRLMESQAGSSAIMDFTPADDDGNAIKCDSFIIYAWGGGGANPPQWAVDGGSYTTLANVPTGISGGGVRSYVLPNIARGFHSLHLKANPSGPSTVVCGAEAVDSMDRGVRWNNAGTDGQITPASGGSANAFGTLNFVGADLVFPEWGINEYLQQVPLATFKARVIEVMQYVQTTLPGNPADCVWLTTLPDASPTGLAITQSAYYATLQEASDVTGVPILRFDQAVTADPNKATYYDDAIHPNTVGHAAFGRFIAKYLAAL